MGFRLSSLRNGQSRYRSHSDRRRVQQRRQQRERQPEFERKLERRERSASRQPKTGGSITVLESKGYSGDWPDGLDPASNLDAIPNQDMMEAIYGQLFILGPGGKIQPDLATGYTFSPDAKTVTITLRQGVKFTDGTPFNAQAVIDNWNRDFGPLAVKAGISPPLERRQDRTRRTPRPRPSRGRSRRPGRTPSWSTRTSRTPRSSTSCSTRSPPGSPRRPPSRRWASRRSPRTRWARGRSWWTATTSATSSW